MKGCLRVVDDVRLGSGKASKVILSRFFQFDDSVDREGSSVRVRGLF